VAIESTNPNLILGMSVSLLYNGAGAVHAWNIEKLPFSNFNLDGFFNGDSVSTLNEIGGTAKKIISVGAYCSKWRFTTWNGLIFDRGIGIDTIWGKLSGFSGTGPSIDGRIKPDITAPGDMVVGAMSRLAVERGQTVIWPDTLSTNGRYTRGTGTSVSSPIVAGIIALMLQAKPDLSTEEARQILKATAIKDKFTGPLSFPNNLWGAGKVNAYGAIAQLLGINAVGKNKSETRPTLASPEIFYRRNQKMVAINFENKTQKIVQLFFYTLSGRLVVSKTLIHQTTSLPQELSKSAYIVELMVDGRQVAKRKLVIW
jgi:subtilisin family serine protease